MYVLSHLSCFCLFATSWSEPASLLCPWDFPRKNTGMGCHSPLRGIFLTHVSNPPHLCLLHYRQILYPQNHLWVKITQLYLTLCDPMDYTVHGLLQARIVAWVTCLFSRGSSQLRDWTQVSCIVGGFFTSWAIKEALFMPQLPEKLWQRAFGAFILGVGSGTYKVFFILID